MISWMHTMLLLLKTQLSLCRVSVHIILTYAPKSSGDKPNLKNENWMMVMWIIDTSLPLDSVYHSVLTVITGDVYSTHHCTFMKKVVFCVCEMWWAYVSVPYWEVAIFHHIYACWSSGPHQTRSNDFHSHKSLEFALDLADLLLVPLLRLPGSLHKAKHPKNEYLGTPWWI